MRLFIAKAPILRSRWQIFARARYEEALKMHLHPRHDHLDAQRRGRTCGAGKLNQGQVMTTRASALGLEPQPRREAT